jgi:hypothetical protein
MRRRVPTGSTTGTREQLTPRVLKTLSMSGDLQVLRNSQRDRRTGAPRCPLVLLRPSLEATACGFPAMADGVLVLRAVGEAGVTVRMLDALRRQVRQADGRGAEPSAGIVELSIGQGHRHRRLRLARDEAGKRFIGTDTLGLLMTVTVCAAHPGQRWRQGHAAGLLPHLAHLPVRVRRRRLRRTPGRLGRPDPAHNRQHRPQATD